MIQSLCVDVGVGGHPRAMFRHLWCFFTLKYSYWLTFSSLARSLSSIGWLTNPPMFSSVNSQKKWLINGSEHWYIRFILATSLREKSFRWPITFEKYGIYGSMDVPSPFTKPVGLKMSHRLWIIIYDSKKVFAITRNAWRIHNHIQHLQWRLEKMDICWNYRGTLKINK